MKKLTTTIWAILLFAGTLFPQVTAVLSIENQQTVADSFFFDLYLRTSQPGEVLYLGNADFVLSFEVGSFNSPIITGLGPEPMYCTFIPTNASPSNNLFTQDLYFNSTSDSINTSLWGNQIRINLDGPAPGNQTTFNTRVARIDHIPSTHRLGRFRVSSISNPNGFMNLQWVPGSIIVSNIAPITFTETPVPVSLDIISNTPLPVELTSFTAAYKNLAVMLSWKTETEVNNYGFNLERRVSEGDWDSIAFIEGNGNSNSPKEYSYTDKELFAGGSKFQYRLKQIDSDGSFEYSDIVEVEVVPDRFELSQNYPNPFNPSTTIRFSLPEATQIKLNLYNMLGELVRTIAEGTYEKGYHKVVVNAENLPSGTYIYRIESPDFVQVKKMILLK